MKFVTIEREGSSSLGVKLDEGIADIRAALTAHPAAEIPLDPMDVIAGGAAAVSRVKEYLNTLPTNGSGNREWLLREDEVSYGPCVTRPGKLICVGLNYRKHAEETGAAIPAHPILFNKFNNALTGHGKEVQLPDKVSREVDYEAELAIVIGRTCKDADRSEALSHVFGYCNANDLSARDLQMRTSQWMLGKICDGFAPLGPYLVTADEVPNPNRLDIKCYVNGEVRQHSNTSDMIFYCDEIVSYISRHMTLEPGDVILTGTPEGVMLGYPEAERAYLRHGDVTTIEIEGLGRLTNRFAGAER